MKTPPTPEASVAKLADSLTELQKSLDLSKAAFNEAIKSGDINAATLAHETLSKTLAAFRAAEKAAMVTLPGGERIAAIDYLGLKQLASDNNLALETVLDGVSSISAGGRVAGLIVNECGISNLSGLSKLGGLTTLNLDNNKIADLTPLDALRKSGCQIVT